MYTEIACKYTNIIGQLNKETRYHSLSVGELCEKSAPGLMLDKETAFKIGLLHDVGKIYIPSRILKKNKRLNEIEREIVDLHAYFGYRLLKMMGEPSDIYLPVLFHHGYTKPRICHPEEPLSEELIRYISLVHTADIYDAMARKRIYHDPYHRENIFEVLAQDKMCHPHVIWEIRKASESLVQKQIILAESAILNKDKNTNIEEENV